VIKFLIICVIFVHYINCNKFVISFNWLEKFSSASCGITLFFLQCVFGISVNCIGIWSTVMIFCGTPVLCSLTSSPVHYVYYLCLLIFPTCFLFFFLRYLSFTFQNRPTPFPGRTSQEATKPGF